jgi:hypothetical protein
MSFPSLIAISPAVFSTATGVDDVEAWISGRGCHMDPGPAAGLFNDLLSSGSNMTDEEVGS